MPYLEIFLKQGAFQPSSRDPNSKPNPSCEFRLVSATAIHVESEYSTKFNSTRARAIKSTLNPIWNEKLWLPLTPESSQTEALQVRCYNEKVLDFQLGESSRVGLTHIGKENQLMTITLYNDKGSVGELNFFLRITQFREDNVIKEGIVEVESRIGIFSKRYFILRPDGLYYYSNEFSNRTLGALQNLSQCSVSAEEEKKRKDKKGDPRAYFVLQTPERTSILRVSNEEERNHWVVALQKYGCVQQGSKPWWFVKE